MPGSQRIWQLRQCGLPLIDTRHSKQIPIPHKAPRGSPLTDLRHACPASATATATVAPEDTTTGEPFTVTVNASGAESGMDKFLRRSRRQVRLYRNFRLRTADLIDQYPRRCH